MPRAVLHLYPLHLIMRRSPQRAPVQRVQLGAPSPIAHCSSYMALVSRSVHNKMPEDAKIPAPIHIRLKHPAQNRMPAQ